MLGRHAALHATLTKLTLPLSAAVHLDSYTTAPLALWNTDDHQLQFLPRMKSQNVYLQPTAAHCIQDRGIMDDTVLYPSIHCSQDQVTVGCGSKKKNHIDYWVRNTKRPKNEKWLWHPSINRHFPAYECTIYSSASAQEMSSVWFWKISLNIIKHKYSPETENKQWGSLLQASSGFREGTKNAERNTVHAYKNSQIPHKSITTYY